MMDRGAVPAKGGGHAEPWRPMSSYHSQILARSMSSQAKQAGTVGYNNVQTAVEDHLIVAREVTEIESDRSQFG